MTPRKLRIALLGDGSSSHIQRLAEGLVKRGHAAFIITPDRLGPYPTIPGVQFIQYDSARKPLRKLRGIQDLLQELKPDVLHSHFVSHGGIIGLATGFHPHVISAWGCDVLNDPRRSRAQWLKTLVALRAADALQPVSEQLREGIIRIGADHPINEVWHWGVDASHFSPASASARADLRGRLGLAEGDLMIFSPRATEPLYHHHVLFDAFPEILRRRPTAKLFLFKSALRPDYEAQLRAQAGALGFASRVIWLERLKYDDLAVAFSAADALISIAWTDGTPMTVLEAMACGQPLVAADISAVRSLISDGTNGFLVDPWKAASVTDGIERLLSLSPQRRLEMGRAARAFVLEHAEREKCMDRLEEFYLKLPPGSGFNWGRTVANLAGLWNKGPL